MKFETLAIKAKYSCTESGVRALGNAFTKYANTLGKTGWLFANIEFKDRHMKDSELVAEIRKGMPQLRFIPSLAYDGTPVEDRKEVLCSFCNDIDAPIEVSIRDGKVVVSTEPPNSVEKFHWDRFGALGFNLKLPGAQAEDIARHLMGLIRQRDIAPIAVHWEAMPEMLVAEAKEVQEFASQLNGLELNAERINAELMVTVNDLKGLFNLQQFLGPNDRFQTPLWLTKGTSIKTVRRIEAEVTADAVRLGVSGKSVDTAELKEQLGVKFSKRAIKKKK